MESKAQLAQLEQLASDAYSPEVSPQKRQQAQLTALKFANTANSIPSCKLLLEQSQSVYGMLFASSSLLKLLTQFWNQFSKEDTVNIRNYLLTYLAQRCDSLPSVLVPSLVQVVARMTKLGWVRDAEHREVAGAIANFLDHGPAHSMIGLQLMGELVSHMNCPFLGEGYSAHRKVAVSFRDRSLLHIFRLTLTTLQKLNLEQYDKSSKEFMLATKVQHRALEVALRCLVFDYIGMHPDEASEDAGSIQIPISWRSLIEDPATVQLFVRVASSTAPPVTTAALEVLVQLSACRRSLFSTTETRTRFLENMTSGTAAILTQNSEAMRESDCYHQFCRVLRRLKGNYQLQDLCGLDSYEGWCKVVADFTLASFKSFLWSAHSIHYLVGCWSRVTRDVPYMRGTLPGFLEKVIPSIAQEFIRAVLDCVPEALSNGQVDILEVLDEPHLQQLPPLVKHNYASVADYLLDRLSSATQQLYKCYHELNYSHMSLVETQASISLFIIGSLICANHPVGSKREEAEMIDAKLIAAVLRLLQGFEARMAEGNIQVGSSTRQVELGIIFFMDNFRKRYLGSMSVRQTIIIVGSRDENTIYRKLTGLLGSEQTEASVLTVMLNKIVSNLQRWSSDSDVLKQTLEFFGALAQFSSSQFLMADLDACKHLLVHHQEANLPFINNPKTCRHATSFYRTLTRFAHKDASFDAFLSFVKPFDQTFNFINQQSNYRSDEVSAACKLLCRQVRGVAEATLLKRSYMNLFDWVHPKHIHLLLRLLETWWDTPNVCLPILKVVSELVFNRNQRISFPTSSANGILLFREASKALSIYSSRILTIEQTNDYHKEKLQGVELSLQILHRALNGGYVNFGVFELYNDKALTNALSAVINLMLSVPLEQYLVHAKVSKELFALLEVLFRNHTPALLDLESTVFVGLISSLHEGLHVFDVAQTTTCAAGLDHIFAFKGSCRDRKTLQKYTSYLERAGDLIGQILGTLMGMVIFDSVDNVWSLSRPIFSILITVPSALQTYRAVLLPAQSAEVQQGMAGVFEALLQDIPQNYEQSTREAFTDRFNKFRLAVAKSCVKPS